jgi:hypothetical protein
MATKKKPAKKAAKKPAKKAAKKPAKKAAKAPAKKAAKKPAKKAAKKAAKKVPAKKAPAKKAAKKAPAKKAAKKTPAKQKATKRAPSSSSASSASSASEAAHIPLPAKKKPLDLASLAGAYKGGDAMAHAVTSEQMHEMKEEGLRSDGEILGVEDADVAPCRLVDHGEGRFSLCFDDFKMPELPLFEERGLQGGGYTWEAIADSLLRLRRPDLVEQVAYDSEAGMFVAVGNRPSLIVVARLLQEALADMNLLKAAVDAADPDRLE